MKTSILDEKNKKFMAENHRWYSLRPAKYAPPSPKVFATKSHAIAFAATASGVHPDHIVYVKPEDVRPRRPRQVIVRHLTCGGRK